MIHIIAHEPRKAEISHFAHQILIDEHVTRGKIAKRVCMYVCMCVISSSDLRRTEPTQLTVWHSLMRHYLHEDFHQMDICYVYTLTHSPVDEAMLF